MQTVIEEKKIEKIIEKVVLRVFKKILEGTERANESAFVAQKGGSFNFLFQEPDLYSEQDIYSGLKKTK